MAAPPSKTVKDLSGVWVMNKSLSDDPDPLLAMQHVSWFTRTAISLATITLTVTQTPETADGPATINIAQVATGGISGTTENRVLDWTPREHSDHIFGRLEGRSRFLPLAEVADDFLRHGWEEAIAETGTVQSLVKAVDSDWSAEQIWGFEQLDGTRYYVRHVVVTNDKAERTQARLVYDFQHEKPEA
ncbi:MAG: hypothetical protein M1832_001793 [Thelocarpon impressellum]|nr:MAG: hypothetical protein M1832_001793 [Thelocarpon impressellum]